jgi:hypothetical protein
VWIIQVGYISWVCAKTKGHMSQILMKNCWNSHAEMQRLRATAALVIIVRWHVYSYVYVCMCIYIFYVRVYVPMSMFRRILTINGIKNLFLVLQT